MLQTLPSFEPRSYDFAEYVPVGNFINGRWVASVGGHTAPVINPRHGTAMGSVAMSGAADVDAAVRAAQAALPGWSATPIKERAQIFFRLKAAMEKHAEELAWMVSHENGKTIEQGRASVAKSIECVEFGCALPNVAAAEQLEVSRGVSCRLVHEPVGVCAGITPFNFPIMVPLWMIPQAIGGGNTFILKPSEKVPYSAARLADLMHDAGVPEGVFNVVNGGIPAVEALLDDERIGAIAFVGSTPVAKKLYARGSQTGRRMLCLGGAKNHLIVVPDADVALTADNVVASFTGCSGQRCMAASVLVGVGDIDHIVDAVAERAERLRVGKDIGCIITAESEARIRGFIDKAEAGGAKVLVDGRTAARPGGGYWVGPTIIDGVKPGAPEVTEEIFGPVLSVVRVDTLEEAIALENSSPYGNASSIYTTNGAIADHVVRRVEAGMVGVNIGVPVPREPFGFGGWNDSKFGHGNITGMDGYRFWTRARKITTKWALQKDWTWMS